MYLYYIILFGNKADFFQNAFYLIAYEIEKDVRIWYNTIKRILLLGRIIGYA